MKIINLFFALSLILPSSLMATCIEGNCINGQGTKVTQSGERWSGSFVNAKLNGEGEWRAANGNFFKGHFMNGVLHGKGMLKKSNRERYIGQFSYGLFHGKGKYSYANGDQYLGEWNEGMMHGQGTYTFASGRVMEGTFEYGGIKEESTMKSEVVSYQAPPTKTKVTTTSSSSKEDIFSNVTKDCTALFCDEEVGIYNYSDGSQYKGEFKKGNPEGKGRCEYINGDVYEGGWKSHSPHGNGIMHFASGQKYAANWDYGRVKEQLLDDLDFITPEKTTTNTFNESVDIYALVVGVARYAHMPTLKYTDDDAYQVYAFLKSPEGGAVPEDKIKVLIDDDASRSNILLAMDQLFSKADANDVVFLYISGHGLEGSFIPSDFNGYSNNIPYKEITKILDKSEAKSKLCIADACHSGSLASSRTPYQASLDGYYKTLEKSRGGTAIMMSSAANELSLEYSGLRQGVFSHYLLKGMKGEADTNGDLLVNITELYQYVSNGVANYTGNIQTPILTGTYDPNMPVAMIRK